MILKTLTTGPKLLKRGWPVSYRTFHHPTYGTSPLRSTDRASLYSFVVYCGSSIFVPSYEAMMAKFGHSRIVVSLVLALYVVGCE
jgi:hypothetical protein